MIKKDVVSTTEKIIEKWKNVKGSLIMVLHEIQSHYGYIPQKSAVKVSKGMRIPLSKIYDVSTFYNLFKLKAPGKHKIAVCMGTACYLKGAPDIINEIKNSLKVEEGGTTKDGLFDLEVVRCIGCCGLAPVMTIDGEIFGKVKVKEVLGHISKFAKKEAQ